MRRRDCGQGERLLDAISLGWSLEPSSRAVLDPSRACPPVARGSWLELAAVLDPSRGFTPGLHSRASWIHSSSIGCAVMPPLANRLDWPSLQLAKLRPRPLLRLLHIIVGPSSINSLPLHATICVFPPTIKPCPNSPVTASTAREGKTLHVGTRYDTVVIQTSGKSQAKANTRRPRLRTRDKLMMMPWTAPKPSHTRHEPPLRMPTAVQQEDPLPWNARCPTLSRNAGGCP